MLRLESLTPGEIDDDERAELEQDIREARDALEDELLALDIGLAIEEERRTRMALGRLGIDNKAGKHWRVSLDYDTATANEVDALRYRRVSEAAALASGQIASRLAILAGENPAPSSDLAVTGAESLLPAYERVKEIAAKRLEVMKRRLDNMRIFLLEAELQTALSDQVIIGLLEAETVSWYNVVYDQATDQIEYGEHLPENIVDSLSAEDIAAGYYVILAARFENIEDDALIRGAATQIIEQYLEDNEPSRNDKR